MIGHGKDNPIELIPAWFHTLLLGPSSDFIHLQHEIEDLDDWGLAREITRFHELDQEATELAAQVEILYEELDMTPNARTMSEKRLVLSHAAQKAAQLKISRRRLAYFPHTLVTRTTVNEDVSSNQRVMLLALRMPGGYRSPHLM